MEEAFAVKRLEAGIYHLIYRNKLGIEEITGSYHALHNLVEEHDELEHYVVIYQNENVSYNLGIDFRSIRQALRNAPKIRADDSIFVDFPTAMRIVTKTMHRVISGNSHIHFVKTLDEAISKARNVVQPRS